MSFLGLMTVRAHEVAMRVERDTVARLVNQRTNHMVRIADLNQEVEGLRDDVRHAEAAFNKAAAAHDKAATELVYWKQHGQLRDPKTGRLIPKPKPSDTFTASHATA